MEKVWECGLMQSRDATVQEWKIRIEEPLVTVFGELVIHIEARLRPIYPLERHVGDGVRQHVC
jgi:hypothetical protein